MVSASCKERSNCQTNQVSTIVTSMFATIEVRLYSTILTPKLCSNVVAATDLTLLSLAGIGLHHEKARI